MKKRIVSSLLLVLFPHSSVLTQPKPEAAPAAFSITGLKFLAGTWQGNAFGGIGTEIWAEPAAGTMLGMWKLALGDTTRLSEFFIVEQKRDTITLRFKHFLPDYSTWEKDAPLVLTLKELSGSSALFESAVQKSPKRMTYTVIGDTLKVRVEGEGKEGKTDFFETVKIRKK
jgi:hypothetical protein